MEKEFFRRRDLVIHEEKENHAFLALGEFSLDKKEFYIFYTNAMQYYLSELNFYYDKDVYKKNIPVFSKKIGEKWKLC